LLLRGVADGFVVW